MSAVEISETILKEMYQHALETYPEECCGVIIGVPHASAEGDRVRRCENVQNRLHAQDPAEYPRDARTAYHMDEREILEIFNEAVAEGKEIKFIYHSHTDHDAYFSREDKRRAMWGGIPAYPNTTYLVISVYGGDIKDQAAFRWDEDKRDFCREELKVVG